MSTVKYQITMEVEIEEVATDELKTEVALAESATAGIELVMGNVQVKKTEIKKIGATGVKPKVIRQDSSLCPDEH